MPAYFFLVITVPYTALPAGLARRVLQAQL